MDQYVAEDAARYRWLRAKGLNFLEYKVLDSAVIIAVGDKLDREVDIKRQGQSLDQSIDLETDAARYRLIRDGKILWRLTNYVDGHPPIFPADNALDELIDYLRIAFSQHRPVSAEKLH
jgi:hypothetical protein